MVLENLGKNLTIALEKFSEIVHDFSLGEIVVKRRIMISECTHLKSRNYLPQVNHVISTTIAISHVNKY